MNRFTAVRAGARWLLAVAYAVAGYLHLAAPEPFVRIVPAWAPAHEGVVLWTGVAEIAGAAGLLQPWSRGLRCAAGIALALYALGVWPANVQHLLLDLARADGGLGLAYHLPRLAAQPLIVWWALWAGEATDWPFARRTRN